ncbi:MAG: hypothetical protein PHT99_05180 [Methanoregula sp.]|nr:hypothetical protein [Methanoregula sp.]
MNPRTLTLCLLVAVCLLALVPLPVQAADPSANVLYQTTFSTDPKWITNNPSMDYWDPGLQQYHFGIEPSTGAYAYVPVDGYEKGPFTLEYDVILNQVDEGTAFRLGFSGTAMHPEEGPNVLTAFTNAKYGRIMWLHLVTPGSKMVEVNSESGDTQSSGPGAYSGATVKYELNKTYHVTVNYNTNDNIVSMKVNEKVSGKEIWGYYVIAGDDLHGMNRIYLGSIGDYGMMSTYTKGYLDNVRLTVPATETEAPTKVMTIAEKTTAPVITKKPAATVPTPYPAATGTPQSPLSGASAIAALGITGLCCGLYLKRRN